MELIVAGMLHMFATSVIFWGACAWRSATFKTHEVSFAKFLLIWVLVFLLRRPAAGGLATLVQLDVQEISLQ